MKILLTLFMSLFLIACSTTGEMPEKGYVELDFDINAEGKAENVKLIRSNLPKEYIDTAIENVKNGKYLDKYRTNNHNSEVKDDSVRGK